MLTIIMILLALTALYCGGMWLKLFAAALKPDALLALKMDRDERVELQNATFHLGLCFVLSLGFLGLLLQSTGS